MQKVDRLVVTLRKGLAGKQEKYKAAITQMLGLTCTNHSVEVPNNFEFRATIRKVETKDEYISRVNKLMRKTALRPPIRVSHTPPKQGSGGAPAVPGQ